MNARNGAAPGTIGLLRILGYLIYVAAFFLPAVHQVATPGAGAPDTYKGWFCAWITIINTLNRQMWLSRDFLAILSGWINPLLFLYVASLFSRKLRLFRRIVAVVIALFIVGTWVYFYLVPLIPLIGHVLWIVGIVLVLAGEGLERREVPIQ
ncbi:MAG: hypothetical protein WBE76_00300 [Terracidiphilus sp.]